MQFNLFNRLRWDDPVEMEINKLVKWMQNKRDKIPAEERNILRQTILVHALTDIERSVNAFIKTAIMSGIIPDPETLKETAKNMEKMIAESKERMEENPVIKEHIKTFLPNSIELMLASWKSHRDEFSNLTK